MKHLGTFLMMRLYTAATHQTNPNTGRHTSMVGVRECKYTTTEFKLGKLVYSSSLSTRQAEAEDYKFETSLNYQKSGMVVHSFTAGTQEVDTGGSLSSESAV